ncbi:CapA family protein [Streptomyces sp. NPDC048506]|uniref:CapA family protein n=1 Tax=Streptomyces sp. NPDC048506 TaxID=3155028 RepID=UPI00343D1E4E
MSAYRRYAVAALLVALAVGCSGPRPVPRPAPRPTPATTPRAHAGAPAARATGRLPFTLVASGDAIPTHPAVLATARDDGPLGGYDFRPMLRGVRPLIDSADLALCHLAAPLGPLTGPFTGYPVLQSPPQIATALKATGYDSCATASNHALDHGVPGVRRTLNAFDTVGLRHTGSARNATEGRRPALLRAPGGARVAELSYTYGIEGGRRPSDPPWGVELLDGKRILADARAARRAGADIVVVSPHWGTEYRTAPDRRQLALARKLTAATTGGRPDVDLIVGTHAHTPQPYEKVHGAGGRGTRAGGRRRAADPRGGGTWVAYGLGDLIGGGTHDERGKMSTTARFTFTPPATPGGRWKVTKAEFIPLWWDAEAGRVIDVNKAIRAGRLDLTPVRHRIRRMVLSRGADKAGLVMGG